MGQICSSKKNRRLSQQEIEEQKRQKQQAKAEQIIKTYFKKDFNKFYKLEEALNESKTVYTVTNMVNGMLRFVRIEPLSKWLGKEEYLQKLCRLDHIHLVKIYEIFWSDSQVHIVEEYFQKGSYIHYYNEEQQLNPQKLENYAAFAMKQLLSAIGYLHSFGLCHGSLNFSNILVNSTNQLKLAGYGLKMSKPIEPSKKPANHLTLFMAPEIISRQPDVDLLMADIWACGVFMHQLLLLRPVFWGNDELKLQKAIVRGIINFETNEWKEISSEARQYILKFFVYKYSYRSTAKELLGDSWLKLGRKVQKGKRVPKKLFRELKRQQKLTTLQQASMAFMVDNVLSQAERDELIQQFEYLDKDGDGVLTKEELMVAFTKKLGQSRAITFVNEIFNKMDSDHSGTINYAEFVCAVYSKKQIFTEEKLELAFKLLDRDHNGTLSYNEVRQLLRSFNLKPNIIKQNILLMDKDKDGRISLEEFKQVLLIPAATKNSMLTERLNSGLTGGRTASRDPLKKKDLSLKKRVQFKLSPMNQKPKKTQ